MDVLRCVKKKVKIEREGKRYQMVWAATLKDF